MEFNFTQVIFSLKTSGAVVCWSDVLDLLTSSSWAVLTHRVYFTDVYNLLNILFINTDTISNNSKEQNCVDWTERLKEHLQLPPQKYDKEETHCTKAKNFKKRHMHWIYTRYKSNVWSYKKITESVLKAKSWTVLVCCTILTYMQNYANIIRGQYS